MALVLDLADPQELLGFTRGIQLELEQNRFTLNQYLPNDMIDEIEFRITQGNLRDADAAKIRAWDTESPIGARQGLGRIMGELPPISKKIRLGEEERLRKRALERGDNKQIIDAIYDDAAQMARAVIARVELLRGEALFDAGLVIAENGVSQTVDFGRDVDHSVTAAILWSEHETAVPVTNMRAWVAKYVDTNGQAPAFVLTSQTVISDLVLNKQIRDLAYNVGGGTVPSFITPDTVNAVFRAFGLPEFRTYDAKVRIDGTQTRVTPDRELVLLPGEGEPLGATLFGTTAEALTLIEAKAIDQDQAPGLVATVHHLDDPVSTWTKVAGIALPVLANPDLTFRAIV